MKLDIFPTPKPVIGMVHLPALPGTQLNKLPLNKIAKLALKDAKALENGGVDAVLIENLNDVPYSKNTVEPHITSAITTIITEIRAAMKIPIGVNVLRNDWRAALGIAAITGASFVRVNVFTGAMITDQGVIEGSPKECIEYRNKLDPTIKVIADVWVKHGIPLKLKGRLSIGQASKDTVYRGLADGVILTGEGTGEPVALEELHEVRGAVPDRPIFIGSGLNLNNINNYYDQADGFIIGTYFKRGGKITNQVDMNRVRKIVDLMAGF
ncbi:MAG: BtpA/SgcQ family protein [Thermoplasmata archaeon]|nr:BtpA/SgcQ family protein [Thermoplasmata archaeon]